MSKFNRTTDQTFAGTSVLVAGPEPTGKTHEGGTGYARDTKSELFLRATCNFVGEDQFYEQAAVADDRLKTLTRELAKTYDGFAWLCEFLPWLRSTGNMRSAPLVLALEAVRVRLMADRRGDAREMPLTNRRLVSVVLQRADEPGEALSYWVANFGRPIPKPVKRGIADAATRLFSEYGTIRWDKPERAYRFADIVEICHPKARGPWQDVLFSHLIDVRRGHGGDISPVLRSIAARDRLNGLVPSARHQFARKAFKGSGPEFDELKLAMASQFEWLISWLGERDEGNGTGREVADEG